MNEHPSCDAYRTRLPDLLRDGDAALATDDALAAHLRTCDACAAAERELRAAWRAFDALPEVVAPPAVAERARSAVLAAMAAETRAASRQRLFDAARMPLAVLSSLLVTAATLALLGGLVWGSALPADTSSSAPRSTPAFSSPRSRGSTARPRSLACTSTPPRASA